MHSGEENHENVVSYRAGLFSEGETRRESGEDKREFSDSSVRMIPCAGARGQINPKFIAHFNVSATRRL